MRKLHPRPRHLAVVVPFSRELLIDEGVIEPTVDERMERRLAVVRQERESAEAAVRRNAWIANARFVTGPVGAAILDLHDPDEAGGLYCHACECGGGDCIPEPWPCSTVLVLAKAAGLDLPPER